MDNSSLKTSSYNGNGYSNNGNRSYLNQSLSPQFLARQEGQEDDWSLRHVLGIAKRRVLVIIGVTITFMTAVVAVTLNQKPVYEAKFQILAEPVSSDNSNLSKLTLSVESSNFNKSSLDYETQIQVLKSPELIRSIVNRLRISYPDINYDSLLPFLTITRLGETKIIEVRYHNSDPVKIKVVLDELSHAYLAYSLENRQINLRQGIQFVEKQLPPLQKRVDHLQKQLQLFRQKYNFTEPTSQSTQIAEQAQQLAEQRLSINQQLAKAQSYFISLQGREGYQAAFKDAPVYQQLLTQERQLEAQIAYESARFQEDSIPVQDLREKQQRLLPLLRKEAQRVWSLKLAEVGNEIQTLESQSQILAQYENELRQQREQLPILVRQYTEIQRNLQVATESLNRFLTTRETLQIEAAQTQIPWQLVQAPTQPTAPVFPNIPRSLILGFVASTLLGIGSALLVEKLDNTYHTVDAFKEKVKLPLLATIPFERQVSNSHNSAIGQKTSTTSIADVLSQTSSESKELVQQVSTLVEDYRQYSSSKFLEALRILHTNIQLLSSDQPIRSIVISSALPAEGKSLIAFHLAQTASAMGQRVLLVDTDLRRPRVHSLSNLNNLWGLSSVISGSLPVETVIRQMPSMSELSVLTTGPIPPDPTKLLSSQKMKQLMADFHKSFDLVIYDAPPLVGLADASLLASHTDGVVFVARMHKTDRSAITQAIDSLKMTRGHILGLVLNCHKSNSLGYHNYY
jgi:succinoglycan biosynthesis transport protein ExoP